MFRRSISHMFLSGRSQLQLSSQLRRLEKGQEVHRLSKALSLHRLSHGKKKKKLAMVVHIYSKHSGTEAGEFKV